MQFKLRRGRIILVLTIFIILVIFYLQVRSKGIFKGKIKKFKKKSGYFLKNIIDDDEILKANENKNIFFIDSDDETEAIIKNARKACNVEAAAHLNPHETIYFIYITPINKMLLYNSSITDALMSYDNIKFRYINPKSFCKGTELDLWIKNDPFWKYSMEQIAEVMKILSLYKYGGTFMSFRTMSLRTINEVNYSNFGCADEKSSVSDGIFRINKKFGEKYFQGFFERLLKAFKIFPITSEEKESSYIKSSKDPLGPKRLFSDTIRTDCPDHFINQHTQTDCDGIILLPTELCGSKLQEKKPNINKEIRKISTSSRAYFIKIPVEEHKSKRYRTNSRIPYVKLAKKFCPKVFKTLRKYI